MKLNNVTLGVIAAVLLALSLFTYRQSAARAERFERGQKFLPQLNPDNIHQIDIVKGEETVTLKRTDEAFEVASHYDYPAKTEAVNRFIKDTLEIGLEKRIGRGESLEKELGVASGAEDARVFSLKNDAGKEMVRFVVGKPGEGGRGNYLKRLDDEDEGVYLTSRTVSLAANNDAYLDKEIVDAPSEEIAQIVGGDFLFEREGEELILKDVPAGKQESANARQVKNLLSSLRYEKVFLADDAAVRDLSFDKEVEVRLKDDSYYVARLAQQDEDYFLRITAGHQTERIGVTREETDEELEKKSETLKRMDEVRSFAEFHGSWVYKLTEFVGKKFAYAKADLIEDEPQEDEEG